MNPLIHSNHHGPSYEEEKGVVYRNGESLLKDPYYELNFCIIPTLHAKIRNKEIEVR